MGWVHSGIGLQGMMSQITTVEPSPTGPESLFNMATGRIHENTAHSQDFEEWLNGLPMGNAPWDLAPLAVWMQQHDPQMAMWLLAAPGPMALAVLGVWAHDPKYRDRLHQYWQEQ